jgi:hypothetical protein
VAWYCEECSGLICHPCRESGSMWHITFYSNGYRNFDSFNECVQCWESEKDHICKICNSGVGPEEFYNTRFDEVQVCQECKEKDEHESEESEEEDEVERGDEQEVVNAGGGEEGDDKEAEEEDEEAVEGEESV